MGMMSKKRIPVLTLLLSLLFLLCGCRIRTGISGQSTAVREAVTGSADETHQGQTISVDSSFAVSSEDETFPAEDSGGPGSRTRENPDASRKEYDENAPVEIVPGTDRLLHGEGEGDGAPRSDEEATLRASLLNDHAEEAATRTIMAEKAEEMGVSEDAEAAESAITYYNVLLRDRMGSLFECQRLNVYWETAQDHITIHKSDPGHSLILNAGCYDVSARLLPENLLVDDGWIVRKNPGVIVKIVESSILGSRINSTEAARAILESLRGREGWAAMDAVKNNRILLLSQELLEAPWSQTMAMVMIARTANPVLFSDVDTEEAFRMLTEEATGSLPTGIYFYSEEE